MIGFQEIKKDTNEVIERFKDKLPPQYIEKVKKELDLGSDVS